MSKLMDGRTYMDEVFGEERERERAMPRNYFIFEYDPFSLPEPRKETEEERKIRERDESYFEFCKKIYG